MSHDNDIRQGRHCVFKMHVHLVFVAKYRRKVFDGDAIERLREIFTRVCLDFESQLVEMDGEHDHVHLLVEYPPKVAVSSLLLRKDRPDIQSRYWKGALVALLFCLHLRRRTHRYCAAIHRAATNTALNQKIRSAVTDPA